ncbi:hemolysin E [Escherichia coli]
MSDIGCLEIQGASLTRFYVDYDDLMLSLLKEAAKKMINTCNEYQKRHGKKTLFEVPEV